MAGEPAALDDLTAYYAAAGVEVRRIDVDYASHTTGMEPLRSELLQLLAGTAARPGDVPLYSTLTGELLDTRTMDAGYWYGNLRGTVQFQAATRALITSGHTVFIEVSPHPVLASSVHAIADELQTQVAVTGTLRRGQGGIAQFQRSAASVFVTGGPVNWRALLPAGGPADLPTYPFDRQRYWLSATAASASRPEQPAETAASLPAETAGTAAQQAPGGQPGPAGQPVPGLAAVPAGELEAFLSGLVRQHAAFALGYPGLADLSPDTEFRDLGLDSLSGMDLRQRLSVATGLELPTALIAEAPTPADLVKLLKERLEAMNS